MRLSLAVAALLLAAPAPAFASAGGAAYPEPVGGAAYGAPSTSRPTIGRFTVPARVREGRLPRVRYRVDELGVSAVRVRIDRKSTRLNSSHSQISYAVFCLKKKNK